MALRIPDINVVSEVTSLRVVRVGKVERWLTLTTNLHASDKLMDKLANDAHEYLKRYHDNDGVEIQSARKKG